MNLLPVICYETDDFAVVYKPPRMHCAPLRHGGETLLGWYANFFPAVMDLTGRKKGEGGLLHRLDFETQGLVLFAKNQCSLDYLLTQQNEGKFIKEYNAIVSDNRVLHAPFFIESYFRPFGPGRKMVRPVTDENCAYKDVAKDKGVFYRTEIVSVTETEQQDLYAVTAKLARGFRHQVRCHLAWIGCPVLNDPLYGEGNADGFLALRACGLYFSDPQNHEPREYRVEKPPITA
jgi:23S rRNA pseudouridine1911/1915/1917 synthase